MAVTDRHDDVPHDDLPRSPTGRVPQWVVDEARSAQRAGRRPDPAVAPRPDAWREGPPLLGPTGGGRGGLRRSPGARRPRGSLLSRLGTVLGVTLVAATVVVAGARLMGAMRDSGLVESLGPLDGAVQVLVHDAGSLGRQAPPAGVEAADHPLGLPPAVSTPSESYAFLQRQPDGAAPVAWDPCRPVHYVVRPDGEPVGGREAVTDAVARVQAATGLVFVDDGETSEAPAPDRAPFQPDRYGARWAPLLVAWSDEDETPALAGTVAGIGGPMAVAVGDGPVLTVTGVVALDVEAIATMAEGVTPGARDDLLRALVQHELGHVLGLDHVDDPTQLMNPELTPGVTDLGDGDRTGLAELGAGACEPRL